MAFVSAYIVFVMAKAFASALIISLSVSAFVLKTVFS